MEATRNGWKVFDARAPILTFEYSFGPGTATALAVGGVGGLVVVSPPYRVAAEVREDLARYGPVTALVASAPARPCGDVKCAGCLHGDSVYAYGLPHPVRVQ